MGGSSQEEKILKTVGLARRVENRERNRKLEEWKLYWKIHPGNKNWELAD